MLQHLNQILRLAPHVLEAGDLLARAMRVFARIKTLVPPCRPCQAVHAQLEPSIRQELSMHVSPMIDSLTHTLLTSPFQNSARRLELVQHLCCPKGTFSHATTLQSAAIGEEGSQEVCDDAAGRLAIVQAALHHIGIHETDVQQAFVNNLPAIFDLLQAAAQQCLALPCAHTISGKLEEEEADLLFRSTVMISALLSVVPGKLRSGAFRYVIAQVTFTAQHVMLCQSDTALVSWT